MSDLLSVSATLLFLLAGLSVLVRWVRADSFSGAYVVSGSEDDLADVRPAHELPVATQRTTGWRRGALQVSRS
ncbi:MAG: hypothetical protein JWQ74_805 [Marmoricola sp.]|nr:hypothetical protein [Marmoricola sp.]